MANVNPNLVPPAVLAAAVGYGLWGFFESPAPKPPGKGEAARLADRLLDPKLMAAPGRNPFQSASQAAAEAAAAAAAAKKAREAAALAAATRTDLAEAGKAEPGMAGPGQPAAITSDAGPEFTLGATLVGGPRRAAIINGRVYALGEKVTAEGSAGGWTLAAVDAESATLWAPSGRMSRVVRFPDRTAEASPARPSPEVTAAAEAPPGLDGASPDVATVLRALLQPAAKAPGDARPGLLDLLGGLAR